MKKILFVGITFLIITICNGQSSLQSNEIETFSIKILDALKTNDHNAFTSLILNEKEYMSELMSPQQKDKEQTIEVQEFRKKTKEVSSKEQFENLRINMRSLKIDFKNVIYKQTKTTIENLKNYKIGKFIIQFNSGGLDFDLTIQDNIRLTSGWKISKMPTIDKGAEKDSTCIEFGYKILAMLKKNSLEEYKKLILKDDEMRKLCFNSTHSAEKKNNIVKGLTSFSSEKNAASAFKEIMTSIQAFHIDLNKIKNVKIEYTKTTDSGGIANANLTIRFSMDDEEFTIIAFGTVKALKGWRLAFELKLLVD